MDSKNVKELFISRIKIYGDVLRWNRNNRIFPTENWNEFLSPI